MRRVPPMAIVLSAIFACLATMTMPVQASSVGIDFNAHSVNVYGTGPVGSLGASMPSAEVGAGFLYDGHEPGDHLKFFHADLLTVGSLGVEGSAGAIGLRGFYGDREHFSGGGVAIGGRLTYYFPQYNRIGIDGGLWYAPNVLTGGDFQHYFQYGLNVDYQLLRQATIYVGYRRLELPIEGIDPGARARAPSQGFHLGVLITF